MSAQVQTYSDFGGVVQTFVPAEVIDKGMTRCLWSPLDVASAQHKVEVPALRHGGEDLAVPTNRLFRGVLPKGVFVPLQKAPEFLPKNFGPDSNDPEILKVSEAPINAPGGPIFGQGALLGFAQYPGYDINTAMRMNQDQGRKRGIKEIEAMRGRDYDPEVYPALQSFFFPNWAIADWDPMVPRIPVEHRLVTELIQDAVVRGRWGYKIEALPVADLGSVMTARFR